MDCCQCKSSEQNKVSEHQSCGSGLGGQCTSLIGRQAEGEVKRLEGSLGSGVGKEQVGKGRGMRLQIVCASSILL